MPYVPEKSLKDVLDSLFKLYKKENGQSSTRVQAIYRKMMGNYISNHTTQIYLKNNVLFLNIDIPSLRHEIMIGKEKLINLINEELGDSHVKDIKFH